MKNKLITLALAALSFSAVSASVAGPSDIIPRPAAVTDTKGTFILPTDGFTYYIKGDSDGALRLYLESMPAEFKPAKSASKASVVIDAGNAPGEEYTLDITPKKITIKSASAAGAFYGVQSLLQMTGAPGVTELQCCRVTDSPRFPYRGLMVDVSRHFRSPEFLKKQIDAMALMKLNNMHLHLTDAAGWRIQIDKYPRLTSFAAWRPQAIWQDWVDNGARYCEQADPNAHGGFYTKAELRDLVDYAAKRHVRLIPEIEIPGHSKEVTSAYPSLSCSGKPYTDEDLCIGKDSTFIFFNHVLEEVMDIFPSEYIHIGGDEASKGGWRNCADCKARMEKEGLKDVDELQSYAIHRVEEYVNSKGRKIIGWDEILEGGLAPNATVMSWRGTKDGVKSIQAGHDVIMTPGEFCYIDYTQDAPFKEPVSIGGYTPLEKVYSYEPVEPAIAEAGPEHLLGVQANLWAEYIPTDKHAEYMYYPRALAIAEIGWATPEKDYSDFRRRSLRLNTRLDSMGYNVFDLANEYGQRRESLTPVNHNARGAKVTYATPYAPQYSAGGDDALTDGVRGGWTHGDRRWQGFNGDFEATVDLGAIKTISSVGADFMHAPGAWIHLPEKVEFLVSENGTDFTPLDTVYTDMDPTYGKIMMKKYATSAPGTRARFVKVRAKGHDRPGAWIFTDEIVID